MKVNTFQSVYRDVYLDVVNQILLMNLVSRQIWLNDKDARECFRKIHNAYCAISSNESLKKKIREEALMYFFSDMNNNNDSDFLSELARKCSKSVSIYDSIGGVISGTLKDLNTSFHDEVNNSIFNNEASRIILTYIFDKLDKYGLVSTPDYTSDSKYVNFISILTESVIGIKETCGYGHKNIYMCLYHFDSIYNNLLIHSFKKRNSIAGNYNVEIEDENLPTKRTDEMLIDAAIWIRLATKIYKCNFSRNTKMFSSAKFEKRMENRHNLGIPPNDINSINNASSLIVDFYDNKPETLLDNGSLEEFASYSDDLCEMLKVLLIDKWYAKHKNIHNAHVNIKKEYEKYKNDTKNDYIAKSKKIEKLFKSIDGSDTIIYAILAFDHLYGTKVNGKIKITDLLKLVNNEYCNSSHFPTQGVKNKLNDLSKRIRNMEYTTIRNKQIELIRHNLIDDREFFPYPLF